MRKNTHATHQLHYQLRYGPFRGKDSASIALLRHCYASVTDEFFAAWRYEIL